MRTIDVTGGFSGSAVVDLSDTLASLTEATIRTALVVEGGSRPPAGSPSWTNPDVDPGSRRATISTLVDGAVAPGRYNLAIEIVQDGRYETMWAADQKRRNRRAVIEVL
jgi:hypothetical protein